VGRTVVVELELAVGLIKPDAVLGENLTGPEVLAPFGLDIRHRLAHHDFESYSVNPVPNPAPPKIALAHTGIVRVFREFHSRANPPRKIDVGIIITLEHPIIPLLISPFISEHSFVDDVHVVIWAGAALPIEKLNGHVWVSISVFKPGVSDGLLSVIDSVTL